MTPTPEALRAAEALNDDDWFPYRHTSLLPVIATVIDSSTNLPALLAERTALREALQAVCEARNGDSGEQSRAWEQAQAALANQGTKA